MASIPPLRPSISTAQDDLVPVSRTSDDAPTPRAQWNPALEHKRTTMDYLSPEMAPRSRSGSSKGKGRAQDVGDDGRDTTRVIEAHDYEAYQEPEYLTVRRHSQRTRLVDGQDGGRGMYEGREDLEMGVDAAVGNRNGVGVVELENAGAAYPPVSEEDAEERRIKEHLAHIAAVDMARRKAARASKQYVAVNTTTPGTGLAPVIASGLSRASTLLRNRTRRGPSASSSGGSSATLVVGNEGGGSGKRPTSGFGFWRIPSVDSTLAEEREDQRRRGWQKQGGDDEADIALKYQPPRSPAPFNRPISRPSSANPFDQPPHTGIHSTGYPIPAPGASNAGRTGSTTDSPSRTTQPGIETEPVPLLRPQSSNYDPASRSPDDAPNGAQPSSTNGPRQHSRMDSASSGWKGPHWYGGSSGGAGYSETTGTSVPGVRQDRWWHALCAWGDDLDDGGEDGQAGRTNPFE